MQHENPFAAPQTERLARRRRSRAWRQARRYLGAAFFFGGAALIYFLLGQLGALCASPLPASDPILSAFARYSNGSPNEQWLPAHATPEQAAEIVFDQFRRTVAQTMEMLEVKATNGKQE